MEPTAETKETPAQRFGELVADLASRIGLDLSPGTGNRILFAERTGMSHSAVTRMLNGRTLPHPAQFESIAREVRCDVRDLFVAAGTISEDAWPKQDEPQALTPYGAVQALGITDPLIRHMLMSGIELALRMQNEAATLPT
ncbi:helix-turn-helix transcriptional regulator (plasmid) [Streptomyces sp. NEAU-sy36]|uniref:helix-turn-helix domain-containing protein n=1 Tax=unclassified Streptomyces TaxID=2593676 RepID=UPI0015D5A119|nr:MULTISPECIES: helix-turn-helix transcriptional regulator [unclassified Streptomyces]QLJ06762.1 helix-turn-helix transcriptional regulator [Streptomyces sp. NEAU-sy36]